MGRKKQEYNYIHAMERTDRKRHNFKQQRPVIIPIRPKLDLPIPQDEAILSQDIQCVYCHGKTGNHKSTCPNRETMSFWIHPVDAHLWVQESNVHTCGACRITIDKITLDNLATCSVYHENTFYFSETTNSKSRTYATSDIKDRESLPSGLKYLTTACVYCEGKAGNHQITCPNVGTKNFWPHQDDAHKWVATYGEVSSCTACGTTINMVTKDWFTKCIGPRVTLPMVDSVTKYSIKHEENSFTKITRPDQMEPFLGKMIEMRSSDSFFTQKRGTCKAWVKPHPVLTPVTHGDGRNIEAVADVRRVICRNGPCNACLVSTLNIAAHDLEIRELESREIEELRVMFKSREMEFEYTPHIPLTCPLQVKPCREDANEIRTFAQETYLITPYTMKVTLFGDSK